MLPYSPVPHPIERLVLQLMAKSPEERPQNARSLIDQIATLADESQRALANPTPLPSLDAHQNTITATDMNKPTTGVVPFKTPMPSAAMTPATSLQPGLTPQPDVSQLLALVPKKKAAAILVAFAAVIVACAVVAMLTVQHFQSARAGVASLPPPPLPPPTPVKHDDEPRPVPVPAATLVPPVPVPAEPPVMVRAEAAKREEKRETRREKQQERKAERASEPVLAEKAGEIRFKPDPPGDWKLGVDGALPLAAPQKFKDLAPGPHEVRWVSRKLDVDKVVTVRVPAGETILLNTPPSL